MLMLASLEAGYVVLGYTFGIVRVLRLTASIVGLSVREAAGIELPELHQTSTYYLLGCHHH